MTACFSNSIVMFNSQRMTYLQYFAGGGLLTAQGL